VDAMGRVQKEAFRWATTSSFVPQKFRFRKGIISHRSANHHMRNADHQCGDIMDEIASFVSR